MRRYARASIALILLLAVGCGGEYEDVTVQTGFQGEARRNPLLAAEIFTRERGFEVESAIVLEAPSASDGVLFVGADQLARARELQAAVRDWTAAGGQLVVTVFGMERPAPRDALVFERCDLLREFEIGETGEYTAIEDTEDPFDPPTTLSPSWGGATRVVPGRRLFDDLLIECEDGPRMSIESNADLRGSFGSRREFDVLTFDLGAGRVTFLSSGSILWNGSLAAKDNAALLWALLEPATVRRAVFVHGRDETLWTLLVSRAPLFVAAAFVLVALALWRMTGRFGPAIVEPPPERHAFFDHVVASGRFLWRHAGPTALAEPVRRRALRAVARRDALDGGDPKAVVAALRERDPNAGDRAEHALLSPVDRDPARFTALLRELHQLERAHD